MVNYYLLRALSMAPDIYGRLFDFIPESRLDTPSDPDRFSPREVMAHVADWDPIFLERMKRAVSQPGVAIEGLDEGEVAKKNRYWEKQVADELKRFRGARAELVAWLESLTDEEWKVEFLHMERGKMSIYDYANTTACHDTYHFEQLARSMGEKTADTW